MTAQAKVHEDPPVPITPEVDFVRIRFAGDSGDGIQLTGTRFAETSAQFGNDFATFPDYPAEIRAPAGTTYGVSAYSINIGKTEILTSGDQPNVLVALNPAALKINLPDLRSGGTILVDADSFTAKNLAKAGYESNPLEDDTLAQFTTIPIGISSMTKAAVADLGIGAKDALLCKNMWTLGLVLWMFGRGRKSVVNWLNDKFKNKPEIAKANIAALHSGNAFGETAEMGTTLRRYSIPPAPVEAGVYRTATGADTLAWGLYAGSRLAGLKLVLGSYPITPASTLLHILSRMSHLGVTTFQAEDEIAAVCSAIGASYAGALGLTTSSGPGVALKTEAIGLAISAELPLVIVNVQRGGPSTGLPTKTEQADLLQAVFGRNGDAPVPVIAASSANDCFDCGIEAVRLATQFMTPVILLTDGYIANAAEPWKIPDLESDAYEPFPVQFRTDPEGFHPFLRDPDTLARNWAIPGTPGLEHRIGGLEEDYDSGNVSYDRENHQRMTDARVNKILGIADHIAEQTVDCGEESGPLAILGWGSTYGAIRIAVRRSIAEGRAVSHVHLRNIWPLPRNLEEVLSRYERIIVPELNTGQLVTLLRSQYQIALEPMNKVNGQPFQVSEIEDAITAALEG